MIGEYEYDVKLAEFDHPEDSVERALALLDIKYKHHRIVKLEYEKERANLLEEPWFNISGGIETSTQTVFDTIAAAAGYGLEANYADARPGELQRSVLSPDKAGRLLGWKPEVNFKDGIAETVAWRKSNLTA